MTRGFAGSDVDYDAPENSDVMAVGMMNGWEFLVVLVPSGTLPHREIPEVIPMGFINRVVVAIEEDYLNRRLDESHAVSLREAAAEGWLDGPGEGDRSQRLAEGTTRHALNDAVTMGRAFINMQGSAPGSLGGL